MHAVADRTLPLRIVENDRAKRLTLRIEAGGRGLRVTIPPGVSTREVDRFMANRSRSTPAPAAPSTPTKKPRGKGSSEGLLDDV